MFLAIFKQIVTQNLELTDFYVIIDQIIEKPDVSDVSDSADYFLRPNAIYFNTILHI
jgi:hypothetical protein